jgi:hypothetical protein
LPPFLPRKLHRYVHMLKCGTQWKERLENEARLRILGELLSVTSPQGAMTSQVGCNTLLVRGMLMQRPISQYGGHRSRLRLTANIWNQNTF